MKCINELKKIGVEKIASKTRITQDKVQNIIDLNYGVFNKTHARGFTQIIEREFGVNMSEWMEALEAHSAVQEEVQETQKDEGKNIKIPIESTKKDKTYIVLSALLAVLVVFFIVLFAYNNFASNSQESVESSLDSANTLDFTNEVDSALNTRDLAENADSTLDSADSANNSADSATSVSKGIEAKNIIIHAESSANEITIVPNEPLWVGVIDLKTRKKQQFSISQKRTINLEGDKIIITGHSAFSITAPNLDKQLLGGNRAYFLFKSESGAKEITRKEFIELNGGAEW